MLTEIQASLIAIKKSFPPGTMAQARRQMLGCALITVSAGGYLD
jgi:hypothetical protein